MKKYLIIPAFLLMCLTTNAQDYNWTVGGSSNLSAIGADQEAGGMFNVSALYSMTDKLQVGAALGLGFGDFESDAAVKAAARYFINDSWFAYGEYALTEAAGDGLALGAGYRVKIGNRVEFNPTVFYGIEGRALQLAMGFAIRF